jgi:hypothetical protein
MFASATSVGCSLLYSADSISGRPAVEAGAGEASSNGCDGALVFCDDFEGGPRDWRTQTIQGGTAVVDTTHPRSGAHSLHARLPPTGSAGAQEQAYLVRTQSWVQPFFVRVWVYLPSPFQKSPTTFLNLNTGSGGTAVFYLGSTGGATIVTFGAVGDASGSAAPIKLDTWVCLEEEFDGNVANVWLDGQPQPLLNLRFPVKNEDVSMSVGISYAASQPSDSAYEAWVDDVAVDIKRVGCDL